MRNIWRPKPGDLIVRRPRAAETQPTTIMLPLHRLHAPSLASPFTVVAGFLVLVVLGTGLLLLPVATTQSSIPSFLTAFFTATSAVTVTGLVVVDTPAFWSTTGHAIIWVLILIGGIGWMTLAGFLLIILGQRITLPQRLAFRESLGTTQIGGVARLIRNMTLTFVVLQGLGGIFLALRFHEAFPWDWPQALWQGFFHSVAGFTNAGFTILPSSASLSSLSGDVVVLGVMGVLILLGGLSFPVLAELVRVRRFSRFSLDTKIILLGSLILGLMGILVIFAFEYNRSDTLEPMQLGDKVLNAAFHSISARSGGFSTIPVDALGAATALFVIGLMFIGSASASVGGGIRLNTMGILVSGILASFRGHNQATAFGREIAPDQVHRAFTIATLALSLVLFTAFILTLTEKNQEFIDLLFETVSAVGTVGLSRGVTPELSSIGQLMIIISMAVGRMGPLILALTLMEREQRLPLYRNARERVKIG